MNDKVTQHPKPKERISEAEAEKIIQDFRKAFRPTSWPLLKFAWYSALLFIATASISGAVWAVVSLVRWL